MNQLDQYSQPMQHLILLWFWLLDLSPPPSFHLSVKSVDLSLFSLSPLFLLLSISSLIFSRVNKFGIRRVGYAMAPKPDPTVLPDLQEKKAILGTQIEMITQAMTTLESRVTDLQQESNDHRTWVREALDKLLKRDLGDENRPKPTTNKMIATGEHHKGEVSTSLFHD